MIESIINERLTELRARYKTIGDAIGNTAEASYQMVAEYAAIRACILLLERILSEASNA